MRTRKSDSMSTINLPTRPTTKAKFTQLRWFQIAANVAIFGLWLWLYRPVFDYLGIIFSREDFRTNQLILVGVTLLIATQIKRGSIRPRFEALPQLRGSMLLLALGGSALYLLVERFLDVNTISASLFGLATYGLLGLWLSPSQWRRGLPALLLLVGTLPFGEHLQTFVGYPMRILTAAVVRDGLSSAGVASVGIDTILVLENGVSQIDLPCSGVKSLWSGMLFLIAATWIERRSFNRRWLMTAALFAGMLFVANVARVGVLVIVGQVAGWRLAAEMLHVPLGVLGFVASCALAVALLRRQPVDPTGDAQQPVGVNDNKPAHHWLSPVLAATILGMALVYAPRPETGLSGAPPDWQFPAELNTEPMPLKPDEIEWLTRDGAISADRRRFEWQGMTGSMILIDSATWRAHHRPERCFEVYGLTLEDSRTHMVRADFPIRLVSLGDGDGQSTMSAAYWFQSSRVVTDDYATRIWADLKPNRERWVLVSILFDNPYDLRSADMQAFYTALQLAVDRSFAGGYNS